MGQGSARQYRAITQDARDNTFPQRTTIQLSATLSHRHKPRPHTHTCTHAHMHTCTHAHMHTCTHAHMHTCTHAHMHTCARGRSPMRPLERMEGDDARWPGGTENPSCPVLPWPHTHSSPLPVTAISCSLPFWVPTHTTSRSPETCGSTMERGCRGSGTTTNSTQHAQHAVG
jgi:hypothetical protein